MKPLEKIQFNLPLAAAIAGGIAILLLLPSVLLFLLLLRTKNAPRTKE